MNPEQIRNFSIIAHIDHGKSTLADRLLEFTGAVSAREKTDQILDSMDLERERGITIKASPVCLRYRAKNGQEYKLNLIDTPGHVDFTYEVSRSLGACEGALLVVDAAQGVEAQTVANVHMALDHNLEILPVINKIDLPSAEPERVKKEIEDVIGLDASNAVLASAKEGIGTEAILEGIVNWFPPPKGNPEGPLRALIIDSWFDPYHGAVVMMRIFDGSVRKGSRIRMMFSGNAFEVTRLGVFSPGPVEVAEMNAGEVGFLMASIKEVAETRIGDTITAEDRPANEPLPGFKPMKPMVFSGLYPTDSGQYQNLRDALEKLRLNDSSFTYEPETSQAASIHLPQEFLGSVLNLCEEKRGSQKEIRYLGPTRVLLIYELPLNEIVVDFYDRLKSVSRGYASMDYEIAGYRPADLVKLDVRINGDLVDAMSMIVHRDKAHYRGRDLVQRMRQLIPRQLFEVVVQAAIGSRVIARESVKPLRKNVTAKCYGGDITRKRKLLERQKEGKKRMKQVGKVEIPQEAFLAALKV